MSMHGLNIGSQCKDSTVSRRFTPLDLVNDDETGVMKETEIKSRMIVLNNSLHLEFNLVRVF